MIEDNHVLIISQCDDGAVTIPKLDKFREDIGADVWHHIAVPPMSTEEFYFLIGQVHNFIQTLIDERGEEVGRTSIYDGFLGENGGNFPT